MYRLKKELEKTYYQFWLFTPGTTTNAQDAGSWTNVPDPAYTNIAGTEQGDRIRFFRIKLTN